VTKFFFIFVMTAVSSVAFGQGHHPYAGLEQRAVKALSEQQIADLRAGRGMGLALPAELNGYPGPSHVLENADALGLSAEQRERTKGLFEAMKAEAVPVGSTACLPNGQSPPRTSTRPQKRLGLRKLASAKLT
jgi:hypothetical protein